MPYHSILDAKTLESIRGQLPADGVLTAVLNVNPGHPDNQATAHLVRAKVLLRESGAPASLVERVLGDVDTAQRATGKTRVYYVWDGGEHVFDLDLDLDSRVSWGAPDVESVQMVLEANPTTAIALVDHERARYFLVRLGRITERRRLENNLVNDLSFTVNEFMDIDEGGRDTRMNNQNNDPDAQGGHRILDPSKLYDLIALQADNQEHKYYKFLADYLEQQRLAGEFKRLLVAGPVKKVTHLKSLLPKGLEGVLAGEFSVEASASAAQVLQAAQDALAAAERDADWQVIHQARERGVRGPADTIAAVQEGRVHQIIVAGDGSDIPVWVDTDKDSSWVFTSYPENGQSPLSGLPVESKTLQDVLPLMRERYGVTVNFVAGENESLVRVEMDGVAGLTRF
ncbi:MAG TPA: hypothetical protein VNT60_00060 [Deinococcales bacterium]|nr:hypothetical protein [Deinococcales bacterium]